MREVKDGTRLAWLSGLSYANGYDVRFRPTDNAERIERLYREAAERGWQEHHGGVPRTEEVFEFVSDHGRVRNKRVTWKPVDISTEQDHAAVKAG